MYGSVCSGIEAGQYDSIASAMQSAKKRKVEPLSKTLTTTPTHEKIDLHWRNNGFDIRPDARVRAQESLRKPTIIAATQQKLALQRRKHIPITLKNAPWDA